MQRTLMTVLCVIAAVVVAWLVVDVALRLAWFVAKLAIVAVVAVVVYAVLRSLLAKRE